MYLAVRGLGGGGGVRRPLGPVLGELFRETLDAGEGFFSGDGFGHGDERARPSLVSAVYPFAQRSVRPLTHFP